MGVSHFQKGQVGDWTNHLTDEQSKRIEDAADEYQLQYIYELLKLNLFVTFCYCQHLTLSSNRNLLKSEVAIDLHKRIVFGKCQLQKSQ